MILAGIVLYVLFSDLILGLFVTAIEASGVGSICCRRGLFGETVCGEQEMTRAS
jgi:hypothetical protein